MWGQSQQDLLMEGLRVVKVRSRGCQGFCPEPVEGENFYHLGWRRQEEEQVWEGTSGVHFWDKLNLKCLLNFKWYWIANGYTSLEFTDKVWAMDTNLEVVRKEGRLKARGQMSTLRVCKCREKREMQLEIFRNWWKHELKWKLSLNYRKVIGEAFVAYYCLIFSWHFSLIPLPYEGASY